MSSLRNIYTKVISVSMLLSMLVQSASAVWIASDTIITAGDRVSYKASGLFSDEVVNMNLVRPDGTNIAFEASSDEWGVVEDSVYDMHTETAGIYELQLQRSFEASPSTATSFTVLPSTVSAYRSEVLASPLSIAADGESVSNIGIVLKDGYGNILRDKPFIITSSRNTDLIIADPKTDNNGIGTATVRSQTTGVAVFTVLVDGIPLYSKPEIVFTEAGNYAFLGDSSGLGSLLKGQLFDEDQAMYAPDVAYFELKGPASNTVEINKNLTFEVLAKNKEGATVNDFEGDVRFSTSDKQGVIPTDYTFTPEDQGRHEFALAVRFNTAGPILLTVFDKNDFRITGEWKGTVVRPGEPTNTNGTRSIKLTAPNPGTYSTTKTTVKGTANNCTTVSLSDNNQLMKANVQVENDGTFSYLTPDLGTGKHTFEAVCDEDTTVKDSREITIDRTAPEALLVEILPSNPMDPNTNFTVNITASEPLAEASCTFEKVKKDLEIKGNALSTTFQAPKNCGEYILACAATDMLGNEISEPEADKIKVCKEDIKPIKGIQDLDTDGDGKTDSEEMSAIDSDNDMVPDYLESNTEDDDNDGMPNNEDNDNDSDGDSINNSGELDNKCSPFDSLNREDMPYIDTIHLYGQELVDAYNKDYDCKKPSKIDGLDDNDSDTMGTDNDTETANNTDSNFIADDDKTVPIKERDTDSDGILDIDEMKAADNDGDGYPDWIESNILDSDNDGVVDEQDADWPEKNGSKLDAPTGLQASKEMNKVTLTWNACASSEGIKSYTIEYCDKKTGECKTNTTPDARTRWYIEGLEECVDYDFTVSCTDKKDTVSPKSKPLKSGPVCNQLPEEAPQTGPMSFPKEIWMVIGALFIGIFSVIMMRKNRNS